MTKDELRAELERQEQRYKDVYGGEVTTYAAQPEPERKPWRKRASLLDQAFAQEIQKIEQDLKPKSHKRFGLSFQRCHLSASTTLVEGSPLCGLSEISYDCFSYSLPALYPANLMDPPYKSITCQSPENTGMHASPPFFFVEECYR